MKCLADSAKLFRASSILCIALMLFGSIACHSDHAHDDHAHDEPAHDDHAHDDHAHDDHDEPAHDDHDDHDHGSEKVRWTSFGEKTQLFTEYPPLHALESATVRLHVTLLEDWSVVENPTIEVEFSGGQSSDVRRVSPGIFETTLAPREQGLKTLEITVDGDRHSREVAVSVDGDHDHKHEGHDEHGDHDHDDDSMIDFSLEQQWSIAFNMAEVVEREVRPSFKAFGSLVARTGGKGVIYAETRGRITVDSMPNLGARVSRGQTLARLTPSLSDQGDLASLDLAVRNAQTRLSAARTERDRIKGLVDDGIVARKRLVDATFAVEEAESNLAAAQSRQRQSRGVSSTGSRTTDSIALKSPIDGIVVGIDVPPGLIVESGKPLFHIVDPDPIWLQVHVPEAQVSALNRIDGVWFAVPGSDEPLEFMNVPVHMGGMIDVDSRTLPVVVEIPNSDGRLRPGMFADVNLIEGPARDSIVIPNDAVVYEDGVPVAYVMADAERFERRPLKLGTRFSRWVAVDRGLEAGEWVVTEGSFALRLAGIEDPGGGHGHHH